MPQIMTVINASWWWLGPAILLALVALFIYLMWDLVRQEIRWWRKKRDWEKFVNEEKKRTN